MAILYLLSSLQIFNSSYPSSIFFSLAGDEFASYFTEKIEGFTWKLKNSITSIQLSESIIRAFLPIIIKKSPRSCWKPDIPSVCTRSRILLSTQGHHCSNLPSLRFHQFSLCSIMSINTQTEIVLHFSNNLSFTIIFAHLCWKIPIPLFLFLLNPSSIRFSLFLVHRNCSCQSDRELPCGQTHFGSHCPFL